MKETSKELGNDSLIEENSLKLALKEAERSKKQLRKIQQLAGIGSFEYLPDEEMIILSDEAVDILTLPSGVNYYSLEDFCLQVRKGLYEKLISFMDVSKNGTQMHSMEFTFKDDKKNRKHIEVLTEKPGCTVQGSICGVFRNITKRKQAELSRTVNAQAFEAIFYHSKISIFVLNLKGEIVDFNDSTLLLFGYTREEMSRMHSTDLLVEEDIMDAAKIFARFIHSAGKMNSFDYRLRKKNGEIIDVLVNFEMIVTSEGEKIYIFINDISGLKAMEKKNIDQERMLIQQSKMATLGEMVALIAHQWQQPINSIAMIVQMLEELIDVDEQNRKMLAKSVESVMAQVIFMSKTMDDFRNFLKPSGVCEDFNLYKIIKEVVSLYRPQLRHYKVDCEVIVDDERLKRADVHGYDNELKNVILNILTNARDAIEEKCPENGQIYIMLTGNSERLKVSIEDNGGGMPDEIMQRIFDPYVSSKGDKGTGLGLYMAKLIIKDRMGGNISLKNTEKGLKVCIELERTDKRETN